MKNLILALVLVSLTVVSCVNKTEEVVVEETVAVDTLEVESECEVEVEELVVDTIE
jgi:uncharacterized lipoprotein NlpE involved in copper resistance